MSQPEPLTEQRLDEISARTDATRPGPWTLSDDLEGDGYPGHLWVVRTPDSGPDEPDDQAVVISIGDRALGEFIAHAREDVPALLADLRRARDRVAELEVGLNDLAALVSQWYDRAKKAEARVTDLEGPAVEARAALAALCYDLEDPGSAALGALYLISRVTVGVEAPRDEAAQVLASHEAQVMRRCAEFVRDTYGGQWADDAAVTLERDADVTEHGCPGYEDAGRGDTVAERQLANCKHCGQPRAVCVAAPEGAVVAVSASQPSEAPVEPETATRPPTGRTGDPLPAEDFTGTQPCGHDDYHPGHPWHDRPNTWCPGHSHDDDQAATEEQSAACARCRKPFDPTDTRFDGRAQHKLTPYCRWCVDLCHDNESADHRCVICA